MPTIPPYSDPEAPPSLLSWLAQFREIFRPVPTFRRGAGTPEAVVKGSIGDRFFRTDGTPGLTMLYYKSTDGGNTGWIAYG